MTNLPIYCTWSCITSYSMQYIKRVFVQWLPYRFHEERPKFIYSYMLQRNIRNRIKKKTNRPHNRVTSSQRVAVDWSVYSNETSPFSLLNCMYIVRQPLFSASECVGLVRMANVSFVRSIGIYWACSGARIIALLPFHRTHRTIVWKCCIRMEVVIRECGVFWLEFMLLFFVRTNCDDWWEWCGSWILIMSGY